MGNGSVMTTWLPENYLYWPDPKSSSIADLLSSSGHSESGDLWGIMKTNSFFSSKREVLECFKSTLSRGSPRFVANLIGLFEVR